MVLINKGLFTVLLMTESVAPEILCHTIAQTCHLTHYDAQMRSRNRPGALLSEYETKKARAMLKCFVLDSEVLSAQGIIALLFYQVLVQTQEFLYVVIIQLPFLIPSWRACRSRMLPFSSCRISYHMVRPRERLERKLSKLASGAMIKL